MTIEQAKEVRELDRAHLFTLSMMKYPKYIDREWHKERLKTIKELSIKVKKLDNYLKEKYKAC